MFLAFSVLFYSFSFIEGLVGVRSTGLMMATLFGGQRAVRKENRWKERKNEVDTL